MKDVTKFSEVDQQSVQQGHLLEFLDFANRQDAALAWKKKMLALLELKPGDAVLDVGCGEGFDTRAMAAAVQPGGRITGGDLSDFLLGVARKRAEEHGLSIEYRKADVMDLPFPDSTFDAVRAERLLMHVPNPAKAISEMKRVLKPSGRLVVFDFDWDAFSIDSSDEDFVRLATRLLSDGMQSGRVGRSLRAHFVEAGFEQVRVTPGAEEFPYALMRPLLSTLDRFVADGRLPAERLEAFWRDQDARQNSGRFSIALMSFIAFGRAR